MVDMTYSERCGATGCPCIDCEDKDQCDSCITYCIWLEERRSEIIGSSKERAKLVEELLNH